MFSYRFPCKREFDDCLTVNEKTIGSDQFAIARQVTEPTEVPIYTIIILNLLLYTVANGGMGSSRCNRIAANV
jgi:hypothetical protein